MDRSAKSESERSVDKKLAEILGLLNDELLQDPQLSDDEALSRFPEYAERLRRYLPMLRSIAALPVSEPSLVVAPPNSVSSPDSQVRLLGDFRILYELGRGGMGTVFAAEQLSVGRRVALKILPFASLAHDKALQRFHNEVRAAAALDHPHIVSVFSAGEERGIHYYSMQLINGQTLAHLIFQLSSQQVCRKAPDNELSALDRSIILGGPQGVPLEGGELIGDSRRLANDSTKTEEQAKLSTVIDPLSNAARYRQGARFGIQAAEALQHAHDEGILHRDVKPSNLLLDAKNRIYVTDFGLARIEADAGVTTTGDILGTLRYMAPEQALARKVVVDQRADVYSLGATLYELLALQPVFGDSKRADLLHKIAFEEPRPLRTINGDIPRDLETIVQKTLEKSANDRYQTAQELADDLRRFVNREPIRATPPTPIHRLAKWSRRHLAIIWATCAASLLIAAGSLIAAAQISQYSKVAKTQNTLAQQAAFTARGEARIAQLALAAEASARQDAESNLYRSHIREAQDALRVGNVSRAETLLLKHLPAPNGVDHRGWEWRYLLGKLNGGSEAVDEHPESVNSVCFSPDGALFAALSASRVRLWRSNPRTLIREIHIPYGMLTGAAFSPSGECLAIASRDGLLRLWAVDASGLLNVVRPTQLDRAYHENIPSWSPNGERIATTVYDGVVIWDAIEAAEEKRINRATGWGIRTARSRVDAVAWRPDGQQLAVGIHGESYLLIVDLETERVRVKSEPHGFDLWSLDWMKDGKRILTGSFDHHAKIIDAETGYTIQDFLNPSHVIQARLSPDERRVACATTGQVIAIWNAEDGTLDSLLAGHRDRVVAVDWSPDGRQLLSGGEDGVLRAWSVGRRDAARDLTVKDVASDFDRGLACRQKLSGGLEVYSLSTGEICYSLQGEGASWSPNGETLAVQAGGTIRVLDAATGAERNSYDDAVGDLSALSWSGDGTALLSRDESDLHIWNAESGIEATTISAPGLVTFSWSPRDRLLALLVDREVQIWDTQQGILLARFSDEQLHDGFQNVDWSPDGRRIATSGWAGRIRVWEARSGRLLRELEGHIPNQFIRTVAWSVDGKLIASGGWDQCVKVWDSINGREIYSLHGHGTAIRSVAFSPDVQRLCSSDFSDSVKLWDLTNGEAICELNKGTIEGGRRLRWSQDGLTVWVDKDGMRPMALDASNGYQLDDSGESKHLIAANASGVATRLALSRRYEESDNALRRAKKHIGAIPVLRYKRALVLLEQSEYERAEKDLEIACSDEDCPEARAQLAWLLANRDDNVPRSPERAEKVAQQLATEWPQVGEFWTLLGLAQYRNAKFAESINTLDHAIELGWHGSSVSNLIKAMASMKLGQEREAVNALDEALETWDMQLFYNASTLPSTAFANKIRLEAQELIERSLE
ncbi:Serine/threonine-protein kinase PknB [Pirellulimonas nuda]|uniref:Serine/threonine-protein kinase PknB n=1 Tax=Pirellulimonas nuda TaxID=2528009 RepID=A0A518DDC8_9BACT|nr:serine/threonine-protein kinase [Pirellulimonas nuda]QDU89477.1 Serine/threonine-protein kinase PknB [Pirellulimonas nuda]